MKTVEIKFYELCDEIDFWKEKAKKAEEEAEYWKAEYSRNLHENMLSAQKGVANALMLALSVQDDENGNLVIDKDSRKDLIDNYQF